MSNFGYTRIGFPKPGPAIATLMLVNVAVFALNFVLGGVLSDGAGNDGMWFAVSWTKLWEGYGLGLLRLLTYQFTHSYTSISHLLFNMITLYIGGSIAEGSVGYRGTFKLYLSGGVVAALCHMLIYWLALGHHVPVVGASGSCLTVFLFAVCVAPRLEILFILFPVQLIFLGFVAVAGALYSTILELRHGLGDGVSNSAHLGGALWGIVAWKANWFRDYRRGGAVGGLVQRVKGWRAKKRTAAAQHEQQQLDDVLAKVKDHGLNSLTRSERAFLDRMSQRGRKS